MALVLADRIKDTTTTTGTGTVTLSGTAPSGFQSFSAVGNGNTTYYAIAGQGTAEWEVGIGTYTSAGTTLSRTTVLASSNAGSLVTFSAGTKDVFVTYPAGKSVYLDASGNVAFPGTLSVITTGAMSLLTLGDGTAGAWSRLNMRGNSTNLAWSMGVQDIVSGAWTLTPSTTNGGNTYTTPVLTVSSTGLAVTGTLSATGNVSFQQAGSNTLLLENTASAANVYFKLKQTTGTTTLGLNATATYFDDTASRAYIWYTNGTERARVDTTGLAVTGTLSSTGTITASNATALTVPNGYQTLYRTTNDTSSLLHLQFFRGTGAGAYAGIYTTGDASNGVASLNLNINGTDIAKASSTGLAVTGTLSATTGTFSSLTSGRVPFVSTSGLITDSTHFTLDTTGFNVLKLKNNFNVGRGGNFTASGTTDTALGQAALAVTDGSGSNNTAIGHATLLSSINASNNTAVGTFALANISAAGSDSNTGVGYYALLNTTGAGSTAVGDSALAALATGSFCTAVGFNAGLNTTGSSNIFIGYNAGKFVTSGGSNVIIGAYTGTAAPISATGSNYLVLSDGAGNIRAYWNGANATFNGSLTGRFDPRVSSTTSASSVTPSIASYDIYAFTALAATLTINAPTGTPLDGDKLMFRILDNGTSRTLTWNGTYVAIGVTLPSATTVSKITYVGCIYNAANTWWDVIAVSTQA